MQGQQQKLIERMWQMEGPISEAKNQHCLSRAKCRGLMKNTDSSLYGSKRLDKIISNDIHAFIKHENHLPTNSFKFRNRLSAVTALSAEQRIHGVVAATLGNHRQGVA